MYPSYLAKKKWNNAVGLRRDTAKRFFKVITSAPATAVLFLKALNQGSKRRRINNTFRLFPYIRGNLLTSISVIPLCIYALGQSLSYNHAHCRGYCHNLKAMKIYFIVLSIFSNKDDTLFSISSSRSEYFKRRS